MTGGMVHGLMMGGGMMMNEAGVMQDSGVVHGGRDFQGMLEYRKEDEGTLVRSLILGGAPLKLDVYLCNIRLIQLTHQ